VRTRLFHEATQWYLALRVNMAEGRANELGES
jgi:hypothetical protein